MSQSLLETAEYWVYNDAIVPLSSEQRRISDDVLFPNIDAIKADIEYIREGLDEAVAQVYPNLSAKGYPIGQCWYIRDRVMEIIKNEIHTSEIPWLLGVQALCTYSKTKASVLKGFWWIQNNRNFHNAIQIWDYCIDVGLDTVEPSNQKVSISPIEDCGISEPNDFTDFALIAERYWQQRIYPNIYIPQIAAVFPAISIDDSWVIKLLWGLDSVLWRNILSSGKYLRHFQNASDFITGSPYSNKKLPEKYIEKLARIFGALRNDWDDITRYLCDFEDQWSLDKTESAIAQSSLDVAQGTFGRNLAITKTLGKTLNKREIKVE